MYCKRLFELFKSELCEAPHVAQQLPESYNFLHAQFFARSIPQNDSLRNDSSLKYIKIMKFFGKLSIRGILLLKISLKILLSGKQSMDCFKVFL